MARFFTQAALEQHQWLTAALVGGWTKAPFGPDALFMASAAAAGW